MSSTPCYTDTSYYLEMIDWKNLKHHKISHVPSSEIPWIDNPTPPQIHLISILKSISHTVGYAIGE